MLNFKNITIVYIIVFLLLMIGSLYVYFSLWAYWALVCSYVIIISVTSFNMSMQFFVPAFTGASNTNKKQIALTFDDGPHPKYTEIVLDLLKEYNATATFFCIGKHIEAYPDIFQRIVAEGHAIGNHSYSHKNTIAFNGTKCWIQELKQTDTLIETLNIPKPALFRPPFGVTTPHLAKAIAHTKHQVVGWNIRPFDTSLKNKDAVLRHIKRKIKPGAVILLHDTHERIPYVLEHLLLFLQDNKYESVSVKDFLDNV